jgi:hypothetical protein
MRLAILLASSVFFVGCTSNPAPTKSDQYCYTDEEIVLENGETVSSQKKISCSDRPNVNHITRSAGVAGECRSYVHKIRRNGVTKNVKGFLCRFPDGSWEPVNGVYSY